MGNILSNWRKYLNFRNKKAEVNTSAFFVEKMGLEPTTSCLPGKHSNQLSYIPGIVRQIYNFIETKRDLPNNLFKISYLYLKYITMSTTGSLTVSIENKIATLTFSHPASNSFPSDLLQKLTFELNRISNNSEVTVVILQSEGKTFCAGASFDELLSVSDFETGKKFFSGFADVINAMRKCSKIIIGKVQGKAVGGGVGLISACDIAYAYQDAAIKLSEIAIGIGPFVIEPAVSRKIGKTAMTEMTLQPNVWQTADWALAKGLYVDIFDSQTEVSEAVEHIATKLAQYNPEALTEMKKVFWEGTENWDTLLYERAGISGKLVLSEFTKNALNEFKK